MRRQIVVAALLAVVALSSASAFAGTRRRAADPDLAKAERVYRRLGRAFGLNLRRGRFVVVKATPNNLVGVYRYVSDLNGQTQVAPFDLDRATGDSAGKAAITDRLIELKRVGRAAVVNDFEDTRDLPENRSSFSSDVSRSGKSLIVTNVKTGERAAVKLTLKGPVEVQRLPPLVR